MKRGPLSALLGAQIGVSDLTVKNDVAGELKLRPAAFKTFSYLAERGGEVWWSWENIATETREMIADLIVGGYLIEREYITHAGQVNGRLALRLTDKGKNVLEKHRQTKIVAGEVRPLE